MEIFVSTRLYSATIRLYSYCVYSVNFYRPQRSCGQGNIFTPVCHSFCSQGGRGSASVHAGIPPREQTQPPREQTQPPREQTQPPGSRHPLWEQIPPWTRHPPTPQTRLPGADLPPEQTSPRKQTPAYGLRAAGTHPTGMHSCYI